VGCASFDGKGNREKKEKKKEEEEAGPRLSNPKKPFFLYGNPGLKKKGATKEQLQGVKYGNKSTQIPHHTTHTTKLGKDEAGIMNGSKVLVDPAAKKS